MKIAVVACLLSALTASAGDLTVLFGTHTAAPGKGFSVSQFNTETGALSAPKFLLEAPAPAYFIIAPGQKFLYTCNSNGFISAYAIQSKHGALKLLNQVSSGGGDPSYISLDKTGKYVLAANYATGNFGIWALKSDGSIGDRTAFIQHTGSSVNPQRQSHAFAHSIIVDPSNRFVLVGDLGLDKVMVYKFDAKNGTVIPNDPAFATVAPGAGARHVVFHPNGKWVYVITEMGSTIVQFEWDSQRGALNEERTVSTLPADFKGTSACSELRVHPNGRFVYASNRGLDSIAAFTVDPKTGHLTLVQNVPSGGKTPRNFDFDPSARWMVVTNHGDNKAAVFAIDQKTGLLKPTGAPVDVPSPFCPRFLK